MSRIGNYSWIAGVVAIIFLMLQSVAVANDDFPISLAEVKKALGTPTFESPSQLSYKDKLDVVCWAPSGCMNVTVVMRGTDLANKLFQSKLFTKEESKVILELFKAKDGKKESGRFEIIVKGSTIAEGMILIEIKALPKK